jgi:hypothetical protein
MKFKLNWDGVGIAASLLCAIHCMVLPLVLTSLPLLGIDLVHDPFFEWFMIFLAIGIGVYSLSHGFQKHHHNKTPLLLFAAGASLLILKQVFHDYQLLLIPAVALIVYAHWKNYKMCSRCSCEVSHHKH